MTYQRRILYGAVFAAAAALISAQPAGTELSNFIGMKLLRIEPGSFQMGQDGAQHDFRFSRSPERVDAGDYDEKPVHQVRISRPFFLSATEVTNKQYEQFDPQHRKYRGRQGLSTGDDDAVIFVSWYDAAAFCQWISKKEGRPYRLPTEAEWEYACRAGSTTLYSTGDRLPPGFQKWIGDPRKAYYFQNYKSAQLPPEYGDKKTLRVAETGANPWGLFDMHGNAEEWVFDWYGPYEAGSQTDPVGRVAGDFKVARGGAHSMHPVLLRSANRSAYLPEQRNEQIGFRVALGTMPATRPLPLPPPERYARNVSQTVPQIVKRPADVPYFRGPRVYLKIPPGSTGPEFSAHNHNGSVTECPNGDLLAVWYSCVEEPGHELNNLASRLRRDSDEWEVASLFWDQPDVNDHGPRIWWDGRRTLYHFTTSLTEDLFRTSTDNGVTWSKAQFFAPLGELGNRPSLTREGYIIIPHDSRDASIVISKDGGRTFTSVHSENWDGEPRTGASRMAGIHNGLVQLRDGRLLALGRIDPREIQAKFGFKTPMSISADMGKTWDVTASEFPAISSTQRAVLIRLQEGPLLWCSYTDQARDRKTRKGMKFRDSAGGEFTGYGLYAALSFDEGKTWPVRKLVTPGGPKRNFVSTDDSPMVTSGTEAEWLGYLSIIQARDSTIHLLSSKNHYEFNLAWLKQLPPSPQGTR
jgi:formylglycine-generating enzyme required for sulfatase activity